MAEDPLLAAGGPHAGDHRGVVELVGEDQAVGQEPGDGADRCLVGDIAGGEQQGRWLAVQLGQLLLEQDVEMGGARDVARAAGPGAVAAHRLGGTRQHRLVMAHAEIVVGAPDHDVADAGRLVPAGARIATDLPFEIGEYPVAAFGPHLLHRTAETAPRNPCNKPR